MATSLGQVTSLLPSPTSSHSAEPITDQTTNKRDAIEAALDSADYSALRKIAAQPGGFETSQLRAVIWSVATPAAQVPTFNNLLTTNRCRPILLGSNNLTSPTPSLASSKAEISDLLPPPPLATASDPRATTPQSPSPSASPPSSGPAPPPTIHRDEGQVKLDVNRSFVNYPKGRLALV